MSKMISPLPDAITFEMISIVSAIPPPLRVGAERRVAKKKDSSGELLA